MENIDKILTSKAFKWAMVGVAEVILLAIFFTAGVKIGYKKASFSYAFGANYERNFVGPARGPMGSGPRFPMDGFRDGMRNAHGLAGSIVSVTDNSIVIRDRNNNENTILVTDKTIIKSRGTDLKLADLKNDDQIVVMGRPDDNGVVNADFIRVFDNQINNNNQ